MRGKKAHPLLVAPFPGLKFGNADPGESKLSTRIQHSLFLDYGNSVASCLKLPMPNIQSG